MGIIRKQTVSGSFFSYAGVVLGFINLAVISPRFFSPEQIGLPALIIAVSIIASQLGSFGFNSVTIRLFPYFRDKETNHNGFLGLSLLIQTFGLLLVILGMIFFIPGLIERNSEDLSILTEFAFLIIPVIIFQLYFVLFDSFSRVLYNAALGIILKEFVVRVLNLITILLFVFDIIDFRQYMFIYVISYGVPALGLVVYLMIKGEFKIRIKPGFLNATLRKEIITVSVYGIIAGLSGIAIMNIDRYMINDFMNLSSVGVYSIAFSFGTLILIPGRAMGKIAAPLLANFWKEKNTSMIHEVYSKSSINQFLGGLALFLVLWINIDDILLLLPEGYRDGKFVILFISLANLLIAISGVSPQILSTSYSYRYHTWFMVLLIVLVVITNLIFIPILGITGAALASLVSTAFYVLVRMLFLFIKYKMQPFRLAHFVSLAAAVIIFLGVAVLPIEFSPLLNVAIRLMVAGLLFLLSIYLLKCSPDFNIIVDEGFRKILRKDRS